MKLILIHASDEAAAADVFAKVLTDSGRFDVERVQETSAVALPDYLDAVVLLWSRTLDPFAQDLDRIALEAWIENRLLIIALDKSERPLGLRDLPAVNATGARQSQVISDSASALQYMVDIGVREGFPDLVREKIEGSAAKVKFQRPALPPEATAPAARSYGGGGTLVEYSGALAFAGLAILLLLWLGSSQTGRGVLAALVGLAILAGIAMLVLRLVRRRRVMSAPLGDEFAPARDPELTAPRAQRPTSDIFVSYAHADMAIVDQVVAAVAAAGKEIWIDRAALRSGDSWAGEIVRAIKAARGMLVMCSAQAFRSDHVKREVYLADKYKKPIVPIFVEPVEPPDDFEYFLAGVQRLDWHSAGAEARRAAVTAAVARL